MENRDTLMQCALDLFAARGYDAVGIQEIVDRGGVTKPTLYHYFGSKHGLLKALVEHYHAPFQRDLQAASAYSGDLPQSLDAVARAFFHFAKKNPQYYRLYLAAYFAPCESEAYRAVVSLNEMQHQLVEDMFKAAVLDHGNMRGRQRLYAASFVGLLNTAIGLWLNGYADLNDDLRSRLLHQFQHGIYS
jgi:TetR/AcrR family transcriptional regulator